MSKPKSRHDLRKNPAPRQGAINAPFNVSQKDAKRAGSIISKIVAQFTARSRVDIKKWRDAIAQAENDRYPKRELWAKLIKDLDLDAHWTSQITIRKLFVMAKPFMVVNKTTRKEIPERTRQFQEPWFYEIMSVALDAKFYGTQAVEIQDLIEGNKKWDAIYTIPQGHLIPERRQILFKDSDNIGEYRGDDPYILWFDEDTFMGLLNKAACHIIWIRNAFQSWVEFCEKFGIPMRYATTNKRDQATIDKLEKMLDQLGSASRAVFPEGTMIDFKEAQTRDAFEVFDKLIVRSSEFISKLLNGVTMISDNGSSKSQGEVHERIFKTIVDSDATDFEAQVNYAIGPQLQQLGYPFNPETEEWIFDKNELLSLGALWNIVQGVLKFYEVDEVWLKEKFGIPVTKQRSAPLGDGTSGNIPNNVKQLMDIIQKLSPERRKAFEEVIKQETGEEVNFNQAQPEPEKVEPFDASGYNELMNRLPSHVTIVEVKNSIESLFKKAATAFFNKPGNKPDVLSTKEWTALFDFTAKKFFGGVEEGYGLKLTAELDQEDKGLLEQLQQNVYHFSAMKDYQLMLKLNGLLKDENGALREKADFMKLALEANEEYNVNWLGAEYNMAVGKATGQARMKEFIAEAAEYDLMWQTVGDDRVRISHEANDGVVVAADSNMAKTTIFPIDWGCRCEWVQVPRGSKKRTAASAITTFEKPAELSSRFGEIFTDQHGYWNGVNNTDRTSLKDFANDRIKKHNE
jgi:phage gp29-like protein